MTEVLLRSAEFQRIVLNASLFTDLKSVVGPNVLFRLDGDRLEVYAADNVCIYREVSSAAVAENNGGRKLRVVQKASALKALAKALKENGNETFEMLLLGTEDSEEGWSDVLEFINTSTPSSASREFDFSFPDFKLVSRLKTSSTKMRWALVSCSTDPHESSADDDVCHFSFFDKNNLGTIDVWVAPLKEESA